MNKGMLVAIFWAFITTILLLQLLAVDEYNLQKAFIYSSVITGTFAIYVHLVLRPIVRKYIESKSLSTLIFWLLLMGILASAVLTLEDYAMDSFFDADWDKYKKAMLPRFFGMLLATILISGIAYAFELYKYHIKMLKATQELKDRLNDLELKSIRQQLSPHFTFNVLNNLQFLIQRDGDEALKLLAQYSKVLRYYVYESQHKTILLNDEILFLKTYLELEKDRLKEEAKMEIALSIAPNEVKIAPFVLATFVENCFKHLSVRDKWIAVLIHFENNNLYMNVKNTYDPKTNETVNHQGIGLEQVKKRLELTYPGKHTLAFEIIDNVFSIELGIQFD